MNCIFKHITAPLVAVVGISILSCAEPEAAKPIPPLQPEKVKNLPGERNLENAPGPLPEKPTTPGQLTRMPLGDLYQLVEKEAALIYDVRPAISYRMGHLPNAISWPKRAFEKDFAKHEPTIKAANKENTPVVLYCTDMACPDATEVGTKLAARGYSVSVLQGGYAAWKIAVQ